MSSKKNIINLISLSLIQVANAITPLVLFPLALASFGSKEYAALATSEVAAIAISILVLYSFEIDGPAKIARLSCGENAQKLSDIFSQILYARLSIFLTVLIIFLPMAWGMFDVRSAGLFTFWLGVPFSFVLQANWLFQAIEKNTVLSIIVILSRIASLGIVLTFVSTVDDVMLIPATISACYVLGGIVSLVYLHVSLGVRLRSVQVNEIWNLLIDGRHIFFANFSVALFRDSNVLILGAIGESSSAVAMYSLGEKLLKGLQAIIRPLNQLFFPRALHILSGYSEPNIRSLSSLWVFLYPQLIASVFLVVTLIIFWTRVVPEDLKVSYVPDQGMFVLILSVMLPAIFFGIANFMLGTTALNFLGQQKYMMRSILATGLGSIVVCSTLAAIFGAIGAGVAFVISEVFLFALIIRKYL